MSYRLALAAGQLISYVPFPVLYLISNLITWVLRSVMHYRQEVITTNLRNAFPEKSQQEITQIRNGFYRNFADIIVESLKSLSISEKEMRKRFKLRNPEVFENLRQKGKGVIMVMGHHTNFEWTAMCTPLMVKQSSFAVYHPLKDKKFNRKIIEIREQFGLQLFKMKDTYPFMLNNSAEAPLYVFMADQSPHKGKVKYKAPFLNQNTPVHLGVENLSKKCDLAVVFIDTFRVKRGYYEVEAKLLYENVQNTKPYEVTNTHVKALEELIKKDPANWLWSHKRWKHA